MVVNARHIKAVPGRKTDVKDAQWIADLLRHGLLRASFIPDRPQRELRELTRHRRSLVEERSRAANRIQKLLEGANIKLASVATDVLRVSGRAMLKAMSQGQEDPEALAELARGRLREKRDELEKALRGLMGPHQRFMLTIQLDHLNHLDGQIGTQDLEVAQRVDPFEKTLVAVNTIPGIGRRTAQIIVAEMGTDMEQFPTPGHLSLLGWGVSGEQPERGKEQTQPHPQRQQLAQTGPGGGRQICRTDQDLSGRPVPAPGTAHRGQSGGHGRGPLNSRHTPPCHPEGAALRGPGTPVFRGTRRGGHHPPGRRSVGAIGP